MESARRLGDTIAVRIKARARDEGAFRLHLQGRQNLAPSTRTAIGLFRPDDADGARISVVPARGVEAELAEEGDGFLPMPVPTDWPVPPDRPDAATWLRHGGAPAALPLRIAPLARAVRAEVAITATLGRSRLETRQETTFRVRHGLLSRVDLAVPPSLDGHWEVEGLQPTPPQRLGPGPGGSTLYRLALRPSGREAPRLALRVRLPIDPPLSPDRPLRIDIPLLRTLEGDGGPTRVTLAPEGAVDLDPIGPGWSPAPAAPSDVPVTTPVATNAPRWSWAGDEPGGPGPSVRASAPELASLPPLLASRLWLHALMLPDGGRRVSATYRIETHPASLALRLPRSASWVGARIDGTPLTTLERLNAPGAFRLRLPTGPAPVLVGVEYLVPRNAPESLIPPLLLEGGVVQQCLAEVRIPWSHAAIGVPPGWTDENSWTWDRYVWKRRPRLDPRALADWVATPATRPPLPEDANEADRGDYHTYLFGRPGDPIPLRLPIASRSGLVAACSGVALALGLLLLAAGRRARRRGPVGNALPAVLALSGLVLAIAVAQAPAVTLLVAQSAAVGIVLTLLAALTRHLVDRDRDRIPGARPRPIPPSGSNLAAPREIPPGGIGSDHSTVIRARTASTVDHHAAPAEPGQGLNGGDG